MPSGRPSSAASTTGWPAEAVAPGPWFGDSAHVMRLGLAYPPADQLEQGLGIIADALRR